MIDSNRNSVGGDPVIDRVKAMFTGSDSVCDGVEALFESVSLALDKTDAMLGGAEHRARRQPATS